MRPFLHRKSWLLAGAGLAILAGAPMAHAQDASTELSSIEKQIRALQAELHSMKHELATKNAEIEATRRRQMQTESELHALPAATTTQPPQLQQGYALLPGTTPGSYSLAKIEPPEPVLPPGTFKVRGVTVTLGGFIEATGIYRSRNEVADVGSNFNTGIPYPNSPLYNEPEFRITSRQSRISLNAAADPDPVTHLDAYYETDFLGAAPTANSVESNSYNLRIRLLYAMYERSDLGLHILAGQDWSLVTLNTKGLEGYVADQSVPYTIDAQYVPGFNWARQAQFRISKDWGKQYWLAFSVENPQANYALGPNGAVPSSVGSVNAFNPGGSLYFSGTNYSDDIAPDFVAKAAVDEPFGHFEVFGLGRLFHDRVSFAPAGGANYTTFGGGLGGGGIVHVIPKRLDFQTSFLIGDGIGRYGSAQLPDATIGANGQAVPLPEISVLTGLIAHPLLNMDWYTYAGEEAVTRPATFSDKGKGYGYGSPLYSNANCNAEFGVGGACVGNTAAIWQATTGIWYKLYHSPDFGSLQLGLQYSYTHRTALSGIGPTPKTDDNMVFFSLRLFPFQDTAPLAPPGT